MLNCGAFHFVGNRYSKRFLWFISVFNVELFAQENVSTDNSTNVVYIIEQNCRPMTEFLHPGSSFFLWAFFLHFK